MSRHILQAEFATPAYDEMVKLRDRILRKPLGLEFYAKDLAKEYEYVHLGCYTERAELIGCCVLVDLGDNILKMRQVAVEEAFQKTGVGGLLVAATEAFAQQNNFKKITLSARKTAVPFYAKHKYKKVGKEFEEVGIPHFKMQKSM